MDIYIVKETFVGASEREYRANATASRDTMAVAIAAAAGATVKEFCRVIVPGIDGRDDHIVTFTIEADKLLSFRPDFAAEDVAVGDVIARAKDDRWMEANPQHPISFGHLVLLNYRALVRCTKGGALVQIKLPGMTSNQQLLLSLRGDREAQRKIMRATRLISEEQIESVIAQLEAEAGRRK